MSWNNLSTLEKEVRYSLLIILVVSFLFSACADLRKQTLTDRHDLMMMKIDSIITASVMPPDEGYEGPRMPEWFDPNDYFAVFNHLRMEKGYALDYIFYCYGNCAPVIYARELGAPPLKSREEYRELSHRWNEEHHTTKDNLPFFNNIWMSHVLVDGTDESFIEYVMLHLIGGQFYLGWHFCRFDDRPVFSHEALATHILNESRAYTGVADDLKRAVRKIKDHDFSPTVTYEDDYAMVRINRFSKWGGLMEGRYYVTLNPPHTIMRCDSTVVLEYNCGIRF